MLLWLVFGFWSNGFSNVKLVAGNLMLWMIIALLGWHSFGPAIHN